jgi:uncharacterized protein (DUF885 family)
VGAVLEQLDQILVAPLAASPLSGLIGRDLAPGFPEDVLTVVRGAILPALRRYRAFLAETYLPRARIATALSALPNGSACYRALVRSATTLDPRSQGSAGSRL